jgi:integrase
MSVSSPDPQGSLTEWFIKDKYKAAKLNTVRKAKDCINHFEEFLDNEGCKPTEVDEDVALKFMQDFLKEQKELGAVQQNAVVGYISRFYDHCLTNNIENVNGNPIKKVKQKHQPLDEPRGKEPHIYSVDEIGGFIGSFDNPNWFAPILTMAKTTRRRGEVVNLDLIDVNIDHPACDWKVHSKIRHKDDYIYISPEPSAGEEFRGMERVSGNKTETRRIIPIDEELKYALLLYLQIRGGSDEPHSPLFRNEKTQRRMSATTLTQKITDRAKKMGYWYEPYDENNITAHYFRHWATTKIRDRMKGDSGLIDYLRGDKGGKMSDHYTHWTENKEREYLEIVPKFFDD